MGTLTSRKNVVLQLAVQIESLQKELRKLSRATTLKDLINQFATVLTGIFPRARIDILHRTASGEYWRVLHQGSMRGSDTLSEEVLQSYLKERKLVDIQPLADESEVAVIVTPSTRRKRFSDSDTGALKISLQVLDNAYQSMLQRRKEKELAFALNHRVLQLNSLIDTGIEISKLHQKMPIHGLALERAASLTNASKGFVRVKAKNGSTEEIFFPHGQRTRRAGSPEHCITTAFKFAGRTYTFKLFEKESRRGVLPFEETDQLLLDALARQVHASLENAYLHEQELEKQRFERDISVAASIQQRILPAVLPTISGYDIAGINIPSKLVGGDYFDCVALPNGRYALVVADVAGKGMPAALLVSSLHAYLSAYLETASSLADLAGRLNKVVCRTSTPEKFITAFIALLDPSTGEIETVNAGHNPVYWVKLDGTVSELNNGGVPFGMLDLDLPYEAERIVLGRGDRLLLYTDGIPEAANLDEALYESVSPLKDFLLHYESASASEFIKTLIDDIKVFTGDAPQNDDITALYVIRH